MAPLDRRRSARPARSTAPTARPRWRASPSRVANGGSAPAQVVVTVSGHPLTPEPAAAQGYAIERSYCKLDGTQVDPASSAARTTGWS